MKVKIFVILLSVLVFFSFNMSGKDLIKPSFVQHKKMAKESIFKNLIWKNVGPFFQGGRIVDIEGYDNSPYNF